LEKEKELGELKSCIISTISHEFRTPLTMILGSAQLLRSYGHNWSDEKKLKHFQRVEDCVQHMTQLLEDALFIGKAEAGELQFNPTQLDVKAMTQKIVEEFQGSLTSQQNGQGSTLPTIAVSAHGDNTQASLDEKLMRQALTNLLSNALKFSPKGGIVRCELVVNSVQSIFRIQDEGIGIPQKTQSGCLNPSTERAMLAQSKERD
jgi:signal transduction histidine kinase